MHDFNDAAVKELSLFNLIPSAVMACLPVGVFFQPVGVFFQNVNLSFGL